MCCATSGYVSSGSGDEGPSKSRGTKMKNKILSGPDTVENLLQEILEEGYTSGDVEDTMMEFS